MNTFIALVFALGAPLPQVVETYETMQECIEAVGPANLRIQANPETKDKGFFVCAQVRGNV